MTVLLGILAFLGIIARILIYIVIGISALVIFFVVLDWVVFTLPLEWHMFRAELSSRAGRGNLRITVPTRRRRRERNR